VAVRPHPSTAASAATSGRPDTGIRLADLVAAFSLATDLGLGQPMEHALRSWRIASRLGERMGIDPEARAALYYVVTLAWVGCVADTPEVARWFGDDIAYRRDSFGVDRAGLPMMAYSLRRVGVGSPLVHRLRLRATLVATGGAAIARAFMSHCISTARMAERLGLGESVADELQQVFTRWDGKGVPAGVGGERIAPTVRLFHLADSVEVLHRTRGLDAAVDLARAWRGTQFAPDVVDAFCAAPDDVLAGLDEIADWHVAIGQEPGLQTRMTDDELDAALEAVGDFTDLRSPSRSGHSRAVANLSARAAELSGLPPDDVRALRRAALVHDLGMNGMPATILDKPGPLTPSETERMRMHAYYTERMLARPPALGRIGTIAALANERLDGSGYHRGLSGASIPATGRILAAADAFAAMREPRPYRAALPDKAAAEALRADVRAGRLAADAVDAVLAAAGQRPGKRQGGPSGLTAREVEVLVLIARGASNKQVARALGIAPKTAGTHIERIYSKIGASTRSTATLFAMQQGLLDSFEPLDP
jgi:HD-GYP domain-containing protein (c-di-GMP phosphodiesterase class II)